jgi:hypothetical protein
MELVAPRSAAPVTFGIERRFSSRALPVTMSSSENAPPLSSADVVAQSRGARVRAAELVATSHELRERSMDAHRVAQQLASEYATLVTSLHAVHDGHQEESLSFKSDELRAAVEDYARTLRSIETPPEQSLVLVKTATSSLATIKQLEAAPAVGKVTKWFVAGYYGAQG